MVSDVDLLLTPNYVPLPLLTNPGTRKLPVLLTLGCALSRARQIPPTFHFAYLLLANFPLSSAQCFQKRRRDHFAYDGASAVCRLRLMTSVVQANIPRQPFR